MLRGKIKSTLAIILSLMMILTMFPAETFADVSGPSQESVIVRIEQLDKTDLAPRRVSFNRGDTALDILKQVSTCEESGGFVSKINAYPDNSLEGVYWMFRVNGETPMQDDGKTGHTMSTYELKEGDYIEFYSILYKGDMNSKYAKFDKNQYTTEANVPVELTLLHDPGLSAELTATTDFSIVNGAEILISEKDGKNPNIKSNIHTAASTGKASLVFTEAGEYTVSAVWKDVVEHYNKISRPYATIIVTEASQSDSYVEDVNSAKAALNISSTINTEEISLPSTGANSTIISWASSDESVINTTTGEVTRPANGQNDASLKLTATIVKGSYSDSKEFDLTVKAYTDEDDVNIINQIFDDLQFYKISPQYGENVNILSILETQIASKTDKKVILSLKDFDSEYLDANGNIIKWYEDIANHSVSTIKNLKVNFAFKLNNTTLEKEITTLIPYDESVVIASMKETDGKFLTFDTFKGENTDASNVTKDFILPEQAGEKQAEIRWSTESPYIQLASKVTVDENNNFFRAANIIVPAQDTSATLTATFTYKWDSGREISYDKDFTFTIKAADDAQKKIVEEELQAKIDELFTADKITYSRLEKSGFHFIDDYKLGGIIFNFNIPNEKRNLSDEGILMDWTSSDENLFSFEETYNSNLDKHYKSFLADVIRPNVGQEAKTADLTITLRKDGVEKSITHTIKVAPISQAEIDRDISLLEKIETNFWDGIRNQNTDKNSVETDLDDFDEIYSDETGDLVWVRRLIDTKGLGFKVDENGETSEKISHKFKFSDPAAIDAFTFKIIKRPDTDKDIRLTTYLTSNLLGKYAEVYKDNLDLKRLYKHEINFDMLLKAEGASSNPTEDISYKIETAPSKTSYNVGEKFDASGLIVEKTVKVEGKEDVVTKIAYAGNEGKFTFIPSLEQNLSAENTQITIKFEEASLSQIITVNEVETAQQKLEKYLTENYTAEKAIYVYDESIDLTDINKEQLKIKTEGSYDDYKSVWTSSDQSVIPDPKTGYSFVKILRGTEDKNVSLTVTLTSSEDENVRASKTFDLVIKKISEEEKEAEISNIDKLLNNLKTDESLDVNNITDDFDIKNNGDNVSQIKYDYTYNWSSSNETYAKVKGTSYPNYDVAVIRPTAEEGKQTAELILTVSSKKIPSISKSKSFDIVINPISAEEINKAKEDMQAIKNAFLAKFIGENVSADYITTGLAQLCGASIVDGNVKWSTSTYTAKNEDCKIIFGQGIKNDYINQYTYSLSKRPSPEEGNQKISIDVTIENQKYAGLIDDLQMTVDLTIAAYNANAKSIIIDGLAYTFSGDTASEILTDGLNIDRVKVSVEAESTSALIKINDEKIKQTDIALTDGNADIKVYVADGEDSWSGFDVKADKTYNIKLINISKINEKIDAMAETDDYVIANIDAINNLYDLSSSISEENKVKITSYEKLNRLQQKAIELKSEAERKEKIEEIKKYISEEYLAKNKYSNKYEMFASSSASVTDLNDITEDFILKTEDPSYSKYKATWSTESEYIDMEYIKGDTYWDDWAYEEITNPDTYKCIVKRPSKKIGDVKAVLKLTLTENSTDNSDEEAVSYTQDIEITIKLDESIACSYLDDNSSLYIGDKTENKVYEDFQNDLWLQYDFRSMNSGDTANLYPLRVEEAITNAISNNVERPNFNFEIIYGDSISLSTEKSRDKSVVTAEKPGITVVKVTYDEFTHSKGKFFPASSPVNTAYVVYEVDGNQEINMTSGIDQRSYDTIYYAEGDSVDYTFTPEVKNADSFRVTLNGQEISKNADGSFTAALENRSNIIGIIATKNSSSRSIYRVVDARKIIIDVNNITRPGQEVGVNDEVNISFKGIVMPVYKLATIYNPCMNGWGGKSTRTVYELAGKTYEGPCSQWDLASKNSFKVVFDQEGQAKFTKGHIYCEWFGSELGTDKGAEGQGEPNLDAPIMKGDFSTLPDFTVQVGGEVIVPVESVSFEKEEAELEIVDSQGYILKVNVNPIDARNKEVNFKSSDTSIVKVDSDGRITPVSIGKATITATTEDGGKTATCEVKVIEEKPATEEERQDLAKEIELAKTVNEDGMEAAWNNFQSELSKAEEVFKAEKSLLKEVNEARLALKKAVKVYKEAIQFNYTLVQEKVENGTKITISFPNIDLSKISDKAKALKMVYASNIPGMAIVESKDLKDNKEGLKEFTFLVAKDVAGDFELKDGYIFTKVWNGPTPQFGSYEDKELYRGSMPDIAFTIKEGVVKQTSVKINFTAIGYDKETKEHYYIIPRQELIVNNGTALEYGRENAAKGHMVGGNDHGVTAEEITPLDAILAMHKVKYGDDFTKESSDEYITNGSYLMKIFGQKGSISYMVNDRAPVGDKTDGYGVNEYVLQDGDDLVYFFFGSMYWADYFAYFDKKEMQVKEGQEFELQLKAYYPMDQISGSPGKPTKDIRTEIDLANVELKLVDAKTNRVSDTVIATTDENGLAKIKFDKAGQYIISASTTTDAMMPDTPVILPTCNVLVKKEEVKPQPQNTVTLSVDKNTIGKGYVVASQKFEIQEGDTVCTLLKRVLDERGISIETSYKAEYGSHYIVSIDGDAEFSHGDGSGWMYKVNGIFPNYGVSKYKLKKDDVVEIRYTTNLGVDIGGAYVVNGDDSSKKNEDAYKKTEDDKSIKTEVKSKVDKKSNNKAVATIDDSLLEKAIDETFKNLSDNNKKEKEVSLLIEATEDVDTVETIIPAKIAKKIIENADTFVVNLPSVDVKISKETLEDITKENDGDVKFVASKSEMKQDKFSEDAKEIFQEKIGSRPVYDFNISAGSQLISRFDNEIKISIKYELKDGENPDKLLVYYVNEEGDLQIIKKSSYNEEEGMMYFNAKHFSHYAIGYDDVKFDDIENHWAHNDIDFLASRNIISGQGNNLYKPDSHISRAEFVQILANLAEVGEVSEASNFTDIADNAWYKEAAIWAEKAGITNGSRDLNGNLVFNPTDEISRQDMAVMLTRYMEKVENSNFISSAQAKDFIDANQIADYAKTAVEALQRAEIIDGIKTDDKFSFNPTAKATRAEVAKIIRCFIEQFK